MITVHKGSAIAKRCCLQQIALMTPATRKNRGGGFGGSRRVGF